MTKVAGVLMQILWDPRGCEMGNGQRFPATPKQQHGLGGASVGRRAKFACLRSRICSPKQWKTYRWCQRCRQAPRAGILEVAEARRPKRLFR
jgi:hypothetical protein